MRPSYVVSVWLVVASLAACGQDEVASQPQVRPSASAGAPSVATAGAVPARLTNEEIVALAGVSDAMLDRTKDARLRIEQIGPTAAREVVVGLAVDDLINCDTIATGRRAELLQDFTRGIGSEQGPEKGASYAAGYVAYLESDFCPRVDLTPRVRTALGLDR